MSPPIDLESETEAEAIPPWEARTINVPQNWYTEPPAQREWLLRDSRRDNEGVLPRGKVGLVVAEGGAGKTMVLVQLSLAVATAGRWLGTFDVPQAGKVLLLLGEEDAEEVHRRIHRAVSGGTTPPENMIVTLPLAGMTCSLLDDGEESPFLVWLRDYLVRTGPYALIILDPVSRFSGADAEKDNAAGTRFCQALEALVETSCGATVIAAHHTNKTSRGSGATVDASSARGSSAIVDGVRWVATIAREQIPDTNPVLTFAVAKSNYARYPDPVELGYGEGGVLVRLDDAGRQAAAQARAEADPRQRRQRDRESSRDNDDQAQDGDRREQGAGHRTRGLPILKA